MEPEGIILSEIRQTEIYTVWCHLDMEYKKTKQSRKSSMETGECARQRLDIGGSAEGLVKVYKLSVIR